MQFSLCVHYNWSPLLHTNVFLPGFLVIRCAKQNLPKKKRQSILQLGCCLPVVLQFWMKDSKLKEIIFTLTRLAFSRTPWPFEGRTFCQGIFSYSLKIDYRTLRSASALSCRIIIKSKKTVFGGKKKITKKFGTLNSLIMQISAYIQEVVM